MTRSGDSPLVALSITDLEAGYGSLRVLRSASLELAPGSFGIVAAPNGAGKTTLMSALIGLIRRSGSARIFGESVDVGNPMDSIRKGMSLVPENRQLFQSLSVHENLMLGSFVWLRRRSRRSDRSQIDGQRERCLSLFPILAEREKQIAGTLSGGEQQMLAISRSLMGLPRVLLMDEPSLGLAPIVVQGVRRALAELSRDGLTILITEQNSRAFRSAADVVWRLHDGQLAKEGDDREIQDQTDSIKRDVEAGSGGSSSSGVK